MPGRTEPSVETENIPEPGPETRGQWLTPPLGHRGMSLDWHTATQPTQAPCIRIRLKWSN